MAKQIIIGMYILKAEFLKLGIIDTFVPLLYFLRGRKSKLSQINLKKKKVVEDLLMTVLVFVLILSMALLNFRLAFVFSSVSTK